MEIFPILVDKISSAIKDWLSTNPREEDVNRLYENVKKYHKRVKEACEKGSKVYRLASEIARDDLFRIALGHDNYEKILAYLTNLDNLTKGQKELKKQMCNEILSILEHIWKKLLKSKL
jgi:N-acetyl-gamma-glutamylphosphate reductase